MNESFHLLVWLLQLYTYNVLWVSDCCLTPTQQGVSCIMVNKLIFHEMMMRSILYLSDTLSWIFIVIAHWNNSPRIDMSNISDILSWFRANQSLLFLLNAACLEARNTNFIVFGLTWSGLEPTIYLTRGEHANHYITDAVRCILKK